MGRKMSNSESKRRNSLERYQPRARNAPHDPATTAAGDDDGLTSNFINKLSFNGDDRQHGDVSRDLPNNHNSRNSSNRNRRAVNSHLYARGGGRGRGEGRGRGRGRGRDHVRNVDGSKEGDDVRFNSTNTQNGFQHQNASPATENCTNNKWKNEENDNIRFQNNVTCHNNSTTTNAMTAAHPRKKNTETFKPRHKPADMRILTAHAGWKKYEREVTSRDVMIVHDLFCRPSDLTIYNKLLEEIKSSGVDQQDLWKLWHGDSHVIADDKQRWKDACPTFHMVLHKIQEYFDMDIKATRLNWYRDSSEWKPFHHDAAAIKPDKAKTQNLTVAVSFGAERDAAFEHATTKSVISMPQPNGTIYVFAKDVNVIWRHGILQVPPEKYHDHGRISIIAWGWSEQTQV